MGVGYVFLLLTAFCLEGVVANNTTTTASSDEITNISKAFISLSVLGAAFLIAFLVAKVVDYFYDQAALRDDASDISEHTRQLIRARIALTRFKRPLKEKKQKKKKSEKESKKNAKVFLKLWSKNAKAMKSRPKTDIIINVEEAESGDHLQVNGGVKKSPHVTFIDELNSPGQEGGSTVLSIPVPSIKTRQVGNEAIPSVSAKVAEKENKAAPMKEPSAKKINQKITPKSTPSSGRTSPPKESGKGVTSGQGRTTPTGETTTTTVSGRTTPVMPRAGTGSATTGRTTPVLTRVGPGTGVRVPNLPRAGTTTGNNKTKVAPAQPRPKTTPSPKPAPKAASVKSAVTKTPSTPKLKVKPTQTKK